MKKLIAGINLTLDGFCDHTAIIPDEEIHQHYTDLLNTADTILYGRITFELMKFWKDLVLNPSGEKSMDDFALAMDGITKIVFSRTLQTTDWHSARLADLPLEEMVLKLKQQEGKDILVGCRSLINQLLQLNLIDEYQFCVHPVLAGSGLPLFESSGSQTLLKLKETRVFGSGAVLLCYEPVRSNK